MIDFKRQFDDYDKKMAQLARRKDRAELAGLIIINAVGWSSITYLLLAELAR